MFQKHKHNDTNKKTQRRQRGTARVKCLNQENITDPGLVRLKPRPLQLELTLSLTIDRLVRRIQLRFLVSIYQIFV